MMSQRIRSGSVFFLLAFALAACGGETSPSGGGSNSDPTIKDNQTPKPEKDDKDSGGGPKSPKPPKKKDPKDSKDPKYNLNPNDVKIAKVNDSDEYFGNAYLVEIRGLNGKSDEEIFQILRASIQDIKQDDELVFTVPGKMVVNKTQLKRINFSQTNRKRYESLHYQLSELQDEDKGANQPLPDSTAPVGQDKNTPPAGGVSAGSGSNAAVESGSQATAPSGGLPAASEQDAPVTDAAPGQKTYSEPTGMAIPRLPKDIHLVVPRNRQVDHLIFGFEKADAKIGSNPIEGLKIKKPTAGHTLFPVTLTKLGLEALAADPTLTLPLLVSQGSVARPLNVFRAKGGKGIALPDAFGEDALQEVNIFPQLTAETLAAFKTVALGPQETWVIQYSHMTEQGAVEAAKDIRSKVTSSCSHLIHPGSDSAQDAVMRAFVVGLHRTYTTQTDLPTLSDFNYRYGLANCEMTAIGAAQQLSAELAAPSEIFIASGSVLGTQGDYADPFIDLNARNHAWNMIRNGDNPGSFVSIDVTPSDVGSMLRKKYNENGVREYLPSFLDRTIVQILERMMKDQPLAKEPIQVLEETGYEHEIPKVVQYILENKLIHLYSTAQYLTTRISAELNRSELLAVLEPYSEVAEFTKITNELRTQVFEESVLGYDRLQLARTILKSGKPFLPSEERKNHLVFTSILEARLDKVRFLKSLGFSFNVRNAEGNSPLVVARDRLASERVNLTDCEKRAEESKATEYGKDWTQDFRNEEFGVTRSLQTIDNLDQIIGLL